jgi:hypothetical protein
LNNSEGGFALFFSLSKEKLFSLDNYSAEKLDWNRIARQVMTTKKQNRKIRKK